MWLGILIKAILNWALGKLGLQAAQREREHEARDAGKVEGASDAVAEDLDHRVEAIIADGHAPTEEEMNDLFKPRGGK